MPIDVFFDKHNNAQPNILFIKKDRLFIGILHGIQGHPDLIVEVLSPSYNQNDRVVKKNYIANSVSEYWIVDPIYKVVEVYSLENNVYTLISFAIETEEIGLKVLTDFKIDI